MKKQKAAIAIFFLGFLLLASAFVLVDLTEIRIRLFVLLSIVGLDMMWAGLLLGR